MYTVQEMPTNKMSFIQLRYEKCQLVERDQFLERSVVFFQGKQKLLLRGWLAGWLASWLVGWLADLLIGGMNRLM